MQIPSGKKIFFISDFHLGAPDHASSLEREKIIVQFLNNIKSEAAEIFIVGDMFDFWYEYRQVVPKGLCTATGQTGRIIRCRHPNALFCR